MNIFEVIVGCSTILSAIISVITLKTVHDIKIDVNLSNKGNHNKQGANTNTGTVGGNLNQNNVGRDQYNKIK
jgi:hypothetical protein